MKLAKKLMPNINSFDNHKFIKEYIKAKNNTTKRAEIIGYALKNIANNSLDKETAIKHFPSKEDLKIEISGLRNEMHIENSKLRNQMHEGFQKIEKTIRINNYWITGLVTSCMLIMIGLMNIN